MPDQERVMPVAVTEVPLYLIPRVVADQIRERGASVFRITISRTHWHTYTIMVMTREIRDVPAPLCPETGVLNESRPVPGAGDR
jgi:hypothetical protein